MKESVFYKFIKKVPSNNYAINIGKLLHTIFFLFSRVLNSFYKLYNSKQFNNFAVAIILPFIILGPFVVVAQTESATTSTSSNSAGCFGQNEWRNITEKHMDLQGTESVSVVNASANSVTGGLSWIAGELEPRIMCGAEKMAANPLIDDKEKIGVVSNMTQALTIATFVQPNIDVVQHIAENWVPGVADENYATYASGYTYLQGMGVSKLWSMSLGVALILYVVYVVVIGFFIMFRKKIGGKEAATFMNSIPNVFISLALSLFSFFIVGLVLDASGFITNVIGQVYDVSSWDGALNVTIGDAIYLDQPLSGVGRMWMQAVGGFFGGTLREGPERSGVVSVMGIGSLLAGPGIGFLLSGITGGASMGIGLIVGALPMILSLIIVIIYYFALLFAAVKAFITMVKTAINLIVLTVGGPIQLSIGAIPGQSVQWERWIQGVLRNALIFPAAFAIVNLPIYLDYIGIKFNVYGFVRGDYSNPELGWGATFANGLALALINLLLPIICYNYVSELPTIMQEWFPEQGSKAFAQTSQSAMQSVKGIPILGGILPK